MSSRKSKPAGEWAWTAGAAVLFDYDAAAHQQTFQTWANSGGDRRDGDVVKRRKANVIELIDCKIRLEARPNRADRVETENFGASANCLLCDIVGGEPLLPQLVGHDCEGNSGEKQK